MMETHAAYLPDNQLLKQIVDPSKSEVYGWPDAFSAKTHVWRAREVLTVKPGIVGQTQVVVGTHPSEMLTVYSSSSGSDQASQSFAPGGQNSTDNWLFNATARNYGSDFSNTFAVLAANKIGSGVFLFGNEGFMEFNNLSWTVKNRGNQTEGPRPVVIINSEFQTGDNFTAQCYINAGFGSSVVASVNAALYAVVDDQLDLLGYSAPVTLVSGAGNGFSVNLSSFSGVPDVGDTLAIGFVLNVGGDSALFSLYSANLATTYTNAPIATVYSAPGYSSIQDIVEGVRCIAASVLISDMSSELFNGGQIAICQIPGNQGGTEADPLFFDGLSSIPSSYNGHRGKGAYGFIRPESNVWGQFMSPELVRSEFVRNPTMQAAIVFSEDPTQRASQFMRIQVDVQFEATTTAQILNPRRSRVAPQEIALASDYLSRVRNVCENPLHEKLIAAIKSASESVKKYAPAAASIALKGLTFASKLAPLAVALL